MRWLIRRPSSPQGLHRPHNPARTLALVFLATIVLGTLLLELPLSVREGRLDWVSALFTATSAVCVTGLVVVDTGTVFSPFGQAMIALLIQAGGLGYMTAATLLFLLFRRYPTVHDRLLLRETLGQVTLRDTWKLLLRAVRFALVVELIGAVVLLARFLTLGDFQLGEAVWLAVFHSISAFCNAGFDLFGAYGQGSLQAFRNDWIVNLTIAGLFTIGGLGFAVTQEVLHHRRHRLRLSLHTRIVLTLSALLVALGTLCVLAGEWTNPQTLGALPAQEKALPAFFQSATARTAGFSTLEIGDLRPITLLLLGIFMFIGASPGGTGGGVKTTTFAVVLVAIWAALRGRAEPELMERRVSPELIYRAVLLIFLAFGILIAGMFILTFTESQTLLASGFGEHPFVRLQFEALSAFGTVGLSTGITPALTDPGRIVLIVLMFVGRLGPTAVATALSAAGPPPKRHLPEENVTLG